MNIGMIPAKWAALEPDAEAIIDSSDGRRVTFAQLDEQVRRLANGLRDDLGLGIGDRVAILSRNSVEYLTLYYACGRAGLIAQALNWRLGTAELARILADGAPRVVLSSSEYAGVAEELQALADVDHWLTFGPDGDGSYEDLVAAASATEPPSSAGVGDSDPLFILFTGGTTGQSKGALHSHRSAYMAMVNQTVAERIVPTDVYMLTGQMYHIPVVLAMNYNAHGRPVALINFEPKLALEVIEQERVSAFLGITTMLNWMMAVDGFDSYDLASLRMIMYGGGPMPSTVVRNALETFAGANLLQGYGQTEGTTMTYLLPEVHREAARGINTHRLRSCGREGHVTTLRIVDDEGRPVPMDGETAGEIVVRSEANMLRYWNRPDLTAATIRDGWMHTGDLATWDAQRFVTIVDRAKDMIISGGENIYSAQVEDAIAHHPGVLEVAVIGIPDDEWGENVHAVVVPKPGSEIDEQAVIATAAAHLASYQKPKSVEFVAELPKAPTGKILKRELREPHWAEHDRQV